MKPTERKSAEAIVSNAPETCQGRGISEQRSVLASYMRQHGLTWIKDDATATHLKQSIPTEQRIANYHHGRLGKKAYYTYARIAPSAWWKEAIATMPEGLRWIRLCDGVQHFPLTTIKPGQRQWWKYTETGWKKLRVITRRVDDGVESWITRKFPRKIEGCTIYAGYSGKKRVWLIESGKLTYHADLTGKVMDVTLEDAL
ncbi:MAG: hypothetical protein EBS21_10745, partial [Sphingomonadaceae bacterium]|nr:hypothetical protein [Sphingomonadaceae bacterium]